jgi:menaquinone-specific isochorismate synthase
MGPSFDEARAWLSALASDRLAAVRLEHEPGVSEALPAGDEVVFWDSPCCDGRERAIAMGEGIAARIDANGAQRFDEVAERGNVLLQRIATFGGARPRLFGGFAFGTGEGVAEWSGFGEASFVLPERLVECASNGWSTTLVGTAARLLEPGFLEQATRLRPERARADVVAPHATVEADADSAFTAMVARAIDTIGTGAMEKVVLARRTRVTSERPVEWDRVIRALNRSAHATRFAFVRRGGAFLGATPETLVSLSRGQLTTQAVAGTAPREGCDEAEIRALLESEKDLREHVVVRDTIVRALEPHATAITAEATPHVTTLPNVHHLVSSIAASPRRGAHVVRIAGSLHPTPAVAGWPKEAATRFIRSNEGWSRGWYAAPIGWFDASGEGVFAVGIRSALVDELGAWVYAGAGIVRGSRPELESRETRAKQAPMIAALTGVA